MKIRLIENLGIDWKRQVVEYPIGNELTQLSLGVFEKDRMIDGDIFKNTNNERYACFAVSLKPFEKKEFDIRPCPKRNGNFSTKRSDTGIEISWQKGHIIVPQSGEYQTAPPFVTRIGDLHVNAGQNPPAAVETRIIFSGRMILLLSVTYIFENKEKLSYELKIYNDYADIHVVEKADKVSQTLQMKVDEHWANGIVKSHNIQYTSNVDFWERTEFTVNDDMRFDLQAFYIWDMNGATAFCVNNRDRALCIIPVQAGNWLNATKCRMNLHLHKDGLCFSSLPDAGRRNYVINIDISTNLWNDLADDSLVITSKYNNYEYMIGHSLKQTHRIDRIAARWGSGRIDKAYPQKYSHLTVENDQKNGSHSASPHGQAGDLPVWQHNHQKRPSFLCGDAKIEVDEFLIQAVNKQKESKMGHDPAGEFFITGNRHALKQASAELREWLYSRIKVFLLLGFQSVRVECIALSRPLRDAAIDYNIIRDFIDEAERAWFDAAFMLLSNYLADDDYWPDVKCGFDKGNVNFHSDWYSCLGVCACLLNGYTEAEKWIVRVQKDLDAELLADVYPRGAWIEAPTYQLASLSHMIVLAKVLKNCGYRDFFRHPQFIETMKFLMDIQTPCDPRCGFSMIPPLGDTTCNILTQSWQAIFAWVALEVADHMPEFSRKLMGAWKRGGSMRIPFSYNSGLKLAAAFIDPNLPAENAISIDNDTHIYPGFGAVMRNGTDGYIIIKAGEIHAHYDHDEGSFIWYEKGCPLLTDYGTQYNPNVDQSYLHNRISILHKSDWSRGMISDYRNNYIKMDVDIGLVQEWPEWPCRDPQFNIRSLPSPETIPTQHWTRRLVYLKNIHGLLIIDEVAGGLPYDWNLQLLAKSVVKIEDYYFAEGQFGVDLRIYLPASQKVELLSWSHAGLDETRTPISWREYEWMWETEVTPMGEKTKILRADALPDSRFVALLLTDERDVRFEDNAVYIDGQKIMFSDMENSSGEKQK